MYDGFVKFDMIEERVVGKVMYGNKRYGGEAFFNQKELRVETKTMVGYLILYMTRFA